MYNLLSSLDIPFDDEANFDWCKFELEDQSKYGIYDFYFEKDNQKYIVEMDGYWHKNDNLMNGQTADESKYIDDEKGYEIVSVGMDTPGPFDYPTGTFRMYSK